MSSSTQSARLQILEVLASISSLLNPIPLTRPGCFYCFQTLDPEDDKVGLRLFVECDNCQKQYHAHCWNTNKPCLFCQNDTATEPTNLSSPPLLHPRTRRHGILVRPSTIIYLLNGDYVEYAPGSVVFQQYGEVVNKVVYSILLAIILVLVASYIGVLTYPLLQLREQEALTVSSVANLLFEPALLQGQTMLAALYSGAIAALIFYRPFDSNRRTTSRAMSLSAWLVAGTIALFVIDIMLFELSLAELMNLESTINTHTESLIAQGMATSVTILLIPLYHWLAPEIPPLGIIRSPAGQEWYGWIRLIVVSLLLVAFAAHLSSRVLLPLSSTFVLAGVSFGGLQIRFEPTITTSFLIGLVTAALFYHSPAHRNLESSYGALRLFFVMLCLAAIVLLLRAFPIETDRLLTLIIVTVFTTFTLTPIQRVLS